MEFYLDLIHAIEFVISPVPYITALKVFMKSFKGVCLWDSLFVSGLNQCRTWNCFACYGIFSEVGTAILAGSVPGLGSSKVLVLGTWCKISSTWYLLVLDTLKFKSTWYLLVLEGKVLGTCPSTFKYFCQINMYIHSGLNLEYVSFNKSPLNTIMMNYWNGSYFVLTAWGLQTSRLDCLPWFAGQEYLKSLAHGRWGCDLKLSIFTFISRIDILGISCDTIFPSVEGHKTSLIIGEHWFR